MKFKNRFSKECRFLLLLILLLAAFLRIANNNVSYFSIWVDEADYANRAVYVLNHDWNYNPEKLYDHPPLYMYALTVPFALFGSSWEVARGFNVFLGLLTVVVMYYIGKELKDEKLGLIVALLFAICSRIVLTNRQILIENLSDLLLCTSFLFLARYEKRREEQSFFLSVVVFSFALITKFTSWIFIPVFVVYLIARKPYLRSSFWLSGLACCIIVLPVIFVMAEHDFLGFHLRKTSEAFPYLGTYFFAYSHTMVLTFLVGVANFGFIPLVLWLYPHINKKSVNKFARRIKDGEPVPLLFLLVFVWFLTAFLFFSSLTFIAIQYIYTILAPLLILIGYSLYGLRKWLKLVVPVFLIISILGITYTAPLVGPNDAVEFLKPRLKGDEVIIASDEQIYMFFFRTNTILPVSNENILEKNASFLILKEDVYLKLGNDARNWIETHYVELHRTPSPMGEHVFVIFERK